MYHPKTAERLYRFKPDRKLIFCLRNPIDRAYSNYKREVPVKGEHRSFKRVMNKRPQRYRSSPRSCVISRSVRSGVSSVQAAIGSGSRLA